MFPAVEYGELSYNMRLQNIDSSNIYATTTHDSGPSGGVLPAGEHSSLGIGQASTSLFEAYPPVRPKKVDSDDEGDEDPVDHYGLSPYDEPNVCIICQGELASDDMVRMLSCHHIFHDECVSPWILEKNGMCPLCKRDLVKEIPARVLVDQDEKIGSKLNNESASTTQTAEASSSSAAPNTEAASTSATTSS